MHTHTTPNTHSTARGRDKPQKNNNTPPPTITARACHKQADPTPNPTPPNLGKHQPARGPTRCSRPLSRSQTTTPHPPTTPHTGAGRRAGNRSPRHHPLHTHPHTHAHTCLQVHTRTRRRMPGTGHLIPQNPNSVSIDEPPPHRPPTGTRSNSDALACFHIFQDTTDAAAHSATTRARAP